MTTPYDPFADLERMADRLAERIRATRPADPWADIYARADRELEHARKLARQYRASRRAYRLAADDAR